MAYGSVSDAQVHEWLDEIASKGFVSLHYDTPALGGDEHNEISGGGYERFKMIWSRPTNRQIHSTIDARFLGLTANKIAYFGIWDSKHGGMLRAYSELPEAQVVANGKGFVLHQGDLIISFG